MYLTYVCIVIALVSIVPYQAFPYSSSIDFDDIPSSIPVDSQILRRDVFDPYGFNSILTRFVKRNKLDEIPIKRIIDSINRDEDDLI